MKKITLLLFIMVFCIVISFKPHTAKAQTVDLLAGNIINGAVTGSLLGVGVMGLKNSNDFSPLRVGLGAGIIGGSGIALYDITTLPQGQQFFITGTFNEGNNSSIIILLDTIYGVGVGAVLGTAVMLIQNKPLVQGLQHGGSVGAWAGFGFGFADAFLFAERNRDLTASKLLNRSSIIEATAGSLEIGIGKPALYETFDFGENSLSYDINPGFKILSISNRF